MRPPRVGLILFCMLLLGGLLGAILWKLTGRLWIAIPAGAVGGYFGVIVFNGTVASGGGPDDPRRY